MFNKSLIKVLITTFILASGTANASLSILEKAELFRSKEGSALVKCDVELYKNEVLIKTRKFNVYTSENNRSLIVFKSAADAGQKVLMKGKNYWMFMPKSRRPIRITPMQKLLGEAALGDIATLNWSNQYKVIDEKNENKTTILTLEANKGSASYQKIVLTLNAEDYFPMSASLYLRSGMLSKVATFERGKRDGQDAVVKMTLIDNMKANLKTVINYNEVRAVEIPNKLFNPQILIRSDLEKLLTD
jgi:outer membrane lipoprotein-sorting protein